ncbi:hypothetical protein [Clavibacter nebraskensis]|uniref:Uncharacterized protein n=2 Tax=Clavibacter nebraskensis TaxID=31963 RepID=A0A399QI94_9MICO|nr:hypothetical protein [Clavibacter nebraskensis]KXU19436.1 hypothetical protein VV38_14495 [Clavibacter nebraskensis]OAH19816.1 hypothetical protein A3Q38_07905 [Clavibacter nebraskensis]QGV65433.1 hypothetical protein EGX36_00235 [Clavibacter nebraskensis]QGV68230.1 hypothetical protein EGX37_00235 [Clavibacter nebraskensis]QGV71023.1 hypothetical protein EGX35_00235 [Clavibacter nebraskensis]
MKNIRMTVAGLALTGALLGGGAAVATPPAPAHAIDSLADLCASLPHTKGHVSQAYKDCVKTEVQSHTPTAAELKCYRGAGIAVGALVADHFISKGDARVIAARLIAAGAFGCIGALFV